MWAVSEAVVASPYPGVARPRRKPQLDAGGKPSTWLPPGETRIALLILWIIGTFSQPAN
jgi:hypothetical protein